MKVKDLKDALEKLPDDFSIKYVDRESGRLRDFGCNVELSYFDDKDKFSTPGYGQPCVVFFM